MLDIISLLSSNILVLQQPFLDKQYIGSGEGEVQSLTQKLEYLSL